MPLMRSTMYSLEADIERRKRGEAEKRRQRNVLKRGAPAEIVDQIGGVIGVLSAMVKEAQTQEDLRLAGKAYSLDSWTRYVAQLDAFMDRIHDLQRLVKE